MFDFKRIRLIASREIQATLGKRSYRIGLIVQVLTAAGSLIQIHLLEPLKEEKCLCADKFGHIEGGGFLSGHW